MRAFRADFVRILNVLHPKMPILCAKLEHPRKSQKIAKNSPKILRCSQRSLRTPGRHKVRFTADYGRRDVKAHNQVLLTPSALPHRTISSHNCALLEHRPKILPHFVRSWERPNGPIWAVFVRFLDVLRTSIPQFLSAFENILSGYFRGSFCSST